MFRTEKSVLSECELEVCLSWGLDHEISGELIRLSHLQEIKMAFFYQTLHICTYTTMITVTICQLFSPLID